MSTTLITAMEVIASTPVGNNFAPDLVCNYIKDAEYYLCTDCCFGEEFYLTLLADVKSNIEEYDDCKQYVAGDLVIYGALTYEGVGAIPVGTSPEDNTGNWVLTQKFNSADYQELYDCHLRELLAFITLHASLITTAIKVETFGVMKNNTDYSGSAEDDTILLLKKDLQDKIETRRSFMDKFLTRVNTTLGIDNPARYPLYPANVESLCNDKCKNVRYKDTVNIPFLGSGGKKECCQYDSNNYNCNCCD